MNNRNLFLLVFVGLFGGFVYTAKEGYNYKNSSLYAAKTELETKVDSLQDKKNYWVTLKDSSELTDLANGFISNYDEQINTLEKSISKIEANPEFKKIENKATKTLYSDGIKIIMGSCLIGMAGGTYFLIKDKRRKKEEELEEEN
jgi:hypothetical protein